MGAFVDLTGQRFGRLTVLERDYSDTKNVTWICQCDCGNKVRVRSGNLCSGNTQSCGCLFLDKVTKHGGTLNKHKSRLYHIWNDMKARCYCETEPSYKNYGARGIIVCEEWKNDYASFMNWAILNGYDETLPRGTCTLDRIDVNSNYCPENCRWITHKQQQSNKTNNHLIEYNGEMHTVTEWSELLNINVSTIRGRLFIRGWDVDKTFNTPVNTKFGRRKKEN